MPDNINDRRAFAQHNRIIAIEPARAVGLVGLGKDGCIGSRLGEDINIPAATVPVRLMVNVETGLPLKNICTL